MDSSRSMMKMQLSTVFCCKAVLALGKVKRLLQLGRDGGVLGFALEDEAGVAVKGVLGRSLHRPLAVVLGDRRVCAVLLCLRPVLKEQFKSKVSVLNSDMTLIAIFHSILHWGSLILGTPFVREEICLICMHISTRSGVSYYQNDQIDLELWGIKIALN